MKEDMYRANREGRLTSDAQQGSDRPDTTRSDKARREIYKEHYSEPKNNRSDRTFKNSRGNEDKPRDRLKRFDLTVSPNQLVAQLEKINDVRWPKPMTTDPRKGTVLSGVRSTGNMVMRRRTVAF